MCDNKNYDEERERIKNSELFKEIYAKEKKNIDRCNEEFKHLESYGLTLYDLYRGKSFVRRRDENGRPEGVPEDAGQGTVYIEVEFE